MFRTTRRRVTGALVLLVCALIVPLTGSSATASAAPLPGFRDGYVRADGRAIHYVAGGHGPALVLLHGWPETWRAWSKVMPQLAREHTVVAIDLRGLGESQPALVDEGNYEALAVADDVHAVVAQLGFASVAVAGHDWGGNIGLAYAAKYRSEVTKLAMLEAPPSQDYLDLVAQRPNVLWWDSFVIGAGPVAEQLVAGRERNFYGRIYASSAGAIDQHEAERLAADYGRPGRTHAGFEYFRQQDVGEKAVDDLLIRDGKLTIPVLGAGGELSMGGLVGAKLPRVATTVSSAVIPGSHHWVLDEQPAAVADQLSGFFR